MKKTNTAIILFLILLFTKTFAITNNFQPIGHWAEGPCQSVIADSSVLYINNGPKIDIFDIASPDTVIFKSSFPIAGPAEKLEICDSLLFVFVYDQIISIYNISNPLSPREISSIKFDDYIRQFTVNENYIYTTISSSNLCIHDIHDPSNPVLVSEKEIAGYPWGVCAVDSFIYIGVQDSGLMILNVSDLDSIVNVGMLHIHDDHWVSQIFYDNNKLYIGTYALNLTNAFFQVIDISDRLHPVKLDKISLNGDWRSSALNIHIEDTLAYVAMWSDVGDYLKIIKISDPTNLELEHTLEIPDIHDVFVKDKRCYVSAGSYGLKVYNLTSNEYNLIFKYKTNGYCGNIYVKNDCAFIVSGTPGLKAVDISDPENPASMGCFDEPTVGRGLANNVVVKDNYAFVINSSGPGNILDISNPEDIREISYFHASEGYAACIKDTHIYIANSYFGLFISNISDLENPVNVCTLSISTNSYDIAVNDTLLFLACGSSGTKIINIRNPEDPEIISTINTNGCPLGVCYNDGLLYVAERDHGLVIYNIDNPLNPIVVGHYSENNWFSKLKVRDGIAFITDNNLGLVTLDVQAPDSIKMLGNYNTPSAIGELFLYEDKILATAGNSGFYIFENTFSSNIAPVPLSFSLHPNYPNPFNPQTTISYQLTMNGEVDLSIYDISGKKVVTLVKGHLNAGFYETVWNAAGFTSGIYIARLSCGGESRTTKMVLLK